MEKPKVEPESRRKSAVGGAEELSGTGRAGESRDMSRASREKGSRKLPGTG